MASLPLIFSIMVIIVGYFTSPVYLTVLIIPVLLLSVLAHAGLGLIFAAYFESHSEMQKVVTIFLFAMIFLAPVFYTPEGLPQVVRLIQRIVPLTYAIEAMRALLVEGAGLKAVWRQLSILTALAVISFLAGYRRLDF